MGLEALRRAQASRAYDFSIYALTASGADKVLAETLMLMSGRPLLILPEGHSGRVERVAAAWDGGAAAARALNDALPVLRAAGSVKVATISGDKPVDQVAPLAHALRHLQRRGVHADGVEIERQGLPVHVALERLLKAERADLLVMGGFGHSRLQEIVLGGVTEHMISNAPTAVWLSH
jgi:nucleotide-binding universal stress UspA family protein